MSVSTYIASIKDSRDKLHDKLVSMGLAESGDKLAALANAVDGITDNKDVKGEVKEGGTYAIPAGYHNGSGYVRGVGGGGNYELKPPVEVTPTKSRQTVEKGDYYGLSGVTVLPIPNNYQDVQDVDALPEHVLAGKIVVGLDGEPRPGEMPDNGTVNKTLDTTTGNTSYPIPKGYHSGNGSVQIVTEVKQNIEPQRTVVEVTPTAGKVLSKVTIAAIPSNLQNVQNVDAVPEHVLEGDTFVDATGVEKNGAMPNKAGFSDTIDGLTETEIWARGAA